MPIDIVEIIAEKIRTLPVEEQEEVLKIVEDKISTAKFAKTFWERMIEISAQVPDEEWAKLPSDGSVNHDHYLYGAPKKY